MNAGKKDLKNRLGSCLDRRASAFIGD